MGIVEVAECNSCGKREDTRLTHTTLLPPAEWVYLVRPVNMMGLPTENKYLVCSADCLNLAYHHATRVAKKEVK